MSIISKYEACELLKCYGDVHYFIENYTKIMHPVDGPKLFKMYGYQRNVIDFYQEHKFCIGNVSRQMGMTSLTAAYILWKLTFEENYQIAIVANNIASGQEFINRIKIAYNYLPDFLKQHISQETQKEIRFSNGSGIVAITANSPHSVRGRSLNLIFFDELAFISNSKAEEIWQSIIPCVTVGSSIIVISTPNTSNNLFYRIWKDAQIGKNKFYPFVLTWDHHPHRDDSFKETAIRMIGQAKFNQEYECQFVDEI